MFNPVNSTLGCEAYYQNPSLNLSKFLVYYAISQCLEDSEGQTMGGAGGYGIDLFITAVSNEYFTEAKQIMVLYDESWDITEILIKLESQSQKSFVTYFLPVDKNLTQKIETKPPDHITHKMLPKAKAIVIFVKDDDAFINILDEIGKYPWWSKRARILIMVKDKSLEPTKGILDVLEAEKIFNGVVVSEFIVKDNSSGFLSDNVPLTNITQFDNGTETGGMELQVVALDPYPAPGHTKQSYVARWKGSGFTVIVRPIFQEKISNLQGNKLTACVFDFPPLVIKTEVTPGNFVYSGQEVKIFHEFATILNFTYEFYEAPEGERWGNHLGDNNWTGLIGETMRNADFGFASIFLLDNREMAVDISNPYDEDRGCFGVPRPENLQNWTGLVLPFSWQVWACILAMALVAGPIFSAITRPLGMDKSITVSRGIFYALGSLVSAQKAPQAKSHSLRTFIVVWLVFCWLSFILYRVSLIVSLTTGPSSYRIDTIRQLVRSGLRWGGFKEVLKTFTNTTERDDEKLFDRFEEMTNITEGLYRVAEEGNFAVLDSNKYLMYAANGKFFDGAMAGFHITRECPTRYNVGFAMPIGSPFLEKINELISRLQSAGLIEKWLKDIIYEASIKNPNREKKRKRDRALSLDNMKLCYIIFFGGHFCAFIALCMEKFVVFWEARKGILLEMARKLSIISVGIAPSVIITDTEPDNESLEYEKDKEAQKHGRKASIGSHERVVRLYPPDPDTIDEEDE